MGFEMIGSALIVGALLVPLYAIYRRHGSGKAVKSRLITQIFCFFGVGAALVAFGMNRAMAAEAAEAAGALGGITDLGVGMIAAALATGLSGIGGGVAVSAAASAALGAISENEKVFGRAVLFVGLAEGIALYGMIIAFMILGRF